MIEVKKIVNGSQLTVQVKGRLDTVASKDLSEEMGDLDGFDEVIFDFEDLEYITSAGIRVIMATNLAMLEVNGSVYVKNVDEMVDEVFEMAGLYNIVPLMGN